MDMNTLISMTGAQLGEAEKTAQNTAETVREVSQLRAQLAQVQAELEQTRQELTGYKAEQAERYVQDSVQHAAERAVDNRHWKTAFVVSTVLAVAALVVAIIALFR